MKLMLSIAMTAFFFASSAFAIGNVKSVVFVHGAFADGSSWSKVISLLQKQGIKAVAVQNPLTSLADDVAATDRTINTQDGNVLLVGHSWGGSVITEAGDNEKVAGLLYVAAFAPESGQTSNESVGAFPKTPGIQALKPDQSGFAWLTKENFAANFAQDVKADEQNVLCATQGPVQAKAFDEKISNASFKQRPSWYIVAENDRMIDPTAEKATAKRINAQVTSIKSSHVPMISHPQEVANVIMAAMKRLNETQATPNKVKQAEEEF